MEFYKIELHSFPHIQSAASVYTKECRNALSERPGILEISVINGCGILLEDDKGESIERPSGSFSITTPDVRFRAHRLRDREFFMSFAAIEGDFTYEKYNIDDPTECLDVLHADPGALFLPRIINLTSSLPEVEMLFRRMIMEYLKETGPGTFRAISLWLEICSVVSTLFKETLEDVSPIKFGEYYSRKVKRYVDLHYMERLSVHEIAAMLHITPNYLSRIFKANTGKTLTEFITLTRLHYARRLAYDGKLTASEIAKAVGLCDANYLNRLFRRYYGTGLHACRLVDREISLYQELYPDTETAPEEYL